jgi:chitodextrinase
MLSPGMPLPIEGVAVKKSSLALVCTGVLAASLLSPAAFAADTPAVSAGSRTVVVALDAAVDTTAPTVTVKPESLGANSVYTSVSFKLHDAGLVDKITLNGVEKDLTNNAYSDVNGVHPGASGARLGANVLRVYDVSGNVATVWFTLVTSVAPAPAWNPATVYTTGDQVTFEGATYVAQWWTQNQEPGNPTGSWMELGTYAPAAGDDVRTWTPSWTYTGGETVVHDGEIWRAKWWTRNQEPGNPYGPWQNLGAYEG